MPRDPKLRRVGRWVQFARKSRASLVDQKKRLTKVLAERHEEAERSKGRRPEKTKPVTDSSFLVIPAFVGDNGDRPLPDDVAAWHSPAVNVIQDSLDPSTPLEELQGSFAPNLTAGNRYILEAWVHNLGDIEAPATNVEFFLASVGMGFTAESARLVGATTIAVPRNDRTRATMNFDAGHDDVGHHCLCVRVSSFLPRDLPEDWSNLSAKLYRHVGQQNLDVVAGGGSLTMHAMLPMSRRMKRAGRLRLRVTPTKPPQHILRNPAVTAAYTLRTGLKSAQFGIQSSARFRRDGRTPNSWVFDARRGEPLTFAISVPKGNAPSRTAHSYQLTAYDAEARKTFDGVTILVV